MDDGSTIAPVPTLLRIWVPIKERGPALGLHLNPSKCEFTWLDPNCQLPCPIRLGEEGQVKLVQQRSRCLAFLWEAASL
jgi:hypothetical protein